MNKAYDQNSGAVVAIKRSKKKMFGQNEKDILKAEAEIAQQCAHENVIAILDIAQHQKEICIVMPYMLRSLHDEIRQQEFEPKRTKELMRMLLSGVQFIHRKDVLHRDLKPANILIDNRGQAKLSDFGLAVNLDEKPVYMCYDLVGTWGYMPPEKLIGYGYSIPSDIWVSHI